MDSAKLCARLLECKVNVYSPVVHAHPIAVHGGINPLDHDFWLSFDAVMIRKCDALIVGQLEGWDRSFGVAHEIAEFSKLRKPIHYLDPVTLKLVLPN